MQIQAQKPFYTIEEYLMLEAQSKVKNEYSGGEIFAMADASINHNRLERNALLALGNALKGKPCEVFTSDMRVFVEKKEFFTYPDVVVVCGEPQFYQGDTIANLMNPTLIIEVLSDSTKIYDRTKKFEFYRAISTLTDNILVDQDRIYLEYYQRVNDNKWILRILHKPEEMIEIESLGISIAVKDLYEHVQFEE